MFNKYFLTSPEFIIIASLILSGIVSALIGKYKKQSILVSLTLGFMLGPIGCLIVFFNKSREVTTGENSKLKKILCGEKATLNKEDVEFSIHLLKHYIGTVKNGRIVMLSSLICGLAAGFISYLGAPELGKGVTPQFWVWFLILVISAVTYIQRKNIKKEILRKLIIGLLVTVLASVIVGFKLNKALAEVITILSVTLMLIAIPTFLTSYILTWMSAQKLYWITTQKNFLEPDLNDLEKGKEMDWLYFLFVDKIISPAQELLDKLISIKEGQM